MSLRLCVFVCVSIFRERKSKEDKKQREHGYGTCAEHVCWQTCEAERQHTDQAVQMCVQKRKAFYSVFAGIFMCMAVCMRKEKKMVESMNVSNDTKHRKIMNT